MSDTKSAVARDGAAQGVSHASAAGSHGSCSLPSAATQGKWVRRPAAQTVMEQGWGSDGDMSMPSPAMGWPSALLQHHVPRAAVLSNTSHAFLEMHTSASELLGAVKMGTDFS